MNEVTVFERAPHDERLQVGMVLYPGFTLFDIAGPEAALSAMSQIHLLAGAMAPVPSDSGVGVVPTGTFDDHQSRLDVLFVPGGLGTQAAMEDSQLLAFISRAGGTADYVTSVCTGSLLLAKAGLLEGFKAATHWALRQELAAMGVEVMCDRVVKDRNRISGGGITAGIDFGLVLLAELRGETSAKLAQLMMEYDPEPPFECGSPASAGPELTALARRAFAQAVQDY